MTSITLPLLVVCGDKDSSDNINSAYFAHENAGSRDKTLEIIPGGYHEMFNDIHKDVYLKIVSDWMSSRLEKVTSKVQNKQL